MPKNALFILILLMSACSSQVSMNYPYDSNSNDSLMLLSLSTNEGNKSLGGLVKVAFVEIIGAEENLKVNHKNEVSIRVTTPLDSQLAGNIMLNSYFSEKRYFLLKAKPGKYALKYVVNNVSNAGNQNIYSLCTLLGSFSFEVKSGEVSFIGDFLLAPSSLLSSQQKLVKASNNLSGARLFMSKNINNKAPIKEVATLPAKINQPCSG